MIYKCVSSSYINPVYINLLYFGELINHTRILYAFEIKWLVNLLISVVAMRSKFLDIILWVSLWFCESAHLGQRRKTKGLVKKNNQKSFFMHTYLSKEASDANISVTLNLDTSAFFDRIHKLPNNCHSIFR